MNKTFSAAMSAALLTLTCGAHAQTQTYSFKNEFGTFETKVDERGTASVTLNKVALASRTRTGEVNYRDKENRDRTTRQFSYSCAPGTNSATSGIATRLSATKKVPLSKLSPSENTKAFYTMFGNRKDYDVVSARFQPHGPMSSDEGALSFAKFVKDNNIRYIVGYGFGVPQNSTKEVVFANAYRLMKRLQEVGVQKVSVEGDAKFVAEYNNYARSRAPGALLFASVYVETEFWGGITETDPTDAEKKRKIPIKSKYTGQIYQDQQDKFLDFMIDTCAENTIATANGLETAKYIGDFGEFGNKDAQAKFVAENFDEVFPIFYSYSQGDYQPYSLGFTTDTILDGSQSARSYQDGQYQWDGKLVTLNRAVKSRSDYAVNRKPLPIHPIFAAGNPWAETPSKSFLWNYLSHNSLDSVYDKWLPLYKEVAKTNDFSALQVVQPMWLIADWVRGTQQINNYSSITLNPPASIVAEVNETILLPVRSMAPLGKKSVSWIYNGQPLGDQWYNNSTHTRTTLLLRDSQPSVSGTYYAVVSDNNGFNDHSSFASTPTNVLVKRHTTQAEKVTSRLELTKQVIARVRDECLANTGCAVMDGSVKSTPPMSGGFQGRAIATRNGYPTVQRGSDGGSHGMAYAMLIANAYQQTSPWTMDYPDARTIRYSLGVGCSVSYTESADQGAPTLSADTQKCSTTLPANFALNNLVDAVVAARDAGRQDCMTRTNCAGGSTQFNFPTGPRRFLFGYPDAGVNTRADIGAWVKTSGVTVANANGATLFKVNSAKDPNRCYVSYQQPTALNRAPAITSVQSGCL